ncbi:MAG: hypothetical protein WC716_02450 [Chitinophagaceae bacterium]|jgi:hypothetical protein
MKNSILVAIISFVALFQTGCKKNLSSCDEHKQLGKLTPESSSSMVSTTDFCSLTSREPTLDFGLDRSPSINNYVFSQSQVNDGIANFHTNFKYEVSSVVSNLDTPDNTLSISELLTLYSELESDSVVDYDPDSNYSALRISFGMEGKKIVLIYEPIALKATTVAKECFVVSTDKYYRVDSGDNFVPLSNVDFATLTANLRSSSSKIYITHPNNTGVHKFINASDESGDIRSNIVSFQQISRMYCDNNQEYSLSDRIKFTIVANQNESLTSNYRMHVVANFRLGMSVPATNTFKNYAADYMQMCPTHCNIVLVNYYTY